MTAGGRRCLSVDGWVGSVFSFSADLVGMKLSDSMSLAAMFTFSLLLRNVITAARQSLSTFLSIRRTEL